MKKVTFVCDACGAEHDDPPLSLWMNRADAVLKLKVNGAPAITAIKEDGLLNFCNPECLQAYFSKLVENKKVD
jgi:hypothetical protein